MDYLKRLSSQITQRILDCLVNWRRRFPTWGPSIHFTPRSYLPTKWNLEEMEWTVMLVMLQPGLWMDILLPTEVTGEVKLPRNSMMWIMDLLDQSLPLLCPLTSPVSKVLPLDPHLLLLQSRVLLKMPREEGCLPRLQLHPHLISLSLHVLWKDPVQQLYPQWWPMESLVSLPLLRRMSNQWMDQIITKIHQGMNVMLEERVLTRLVLLLRQPPHHLIRIEE